MFEPLLRERSALIGRATIRAPAARASEARLDIDRIAGAIDFGAMGTGDGSIVVLRSLRCRLAQDLHEVARDSHGLASVARAAQATLRQAARRAVRASSADAPNADAVRFADLAELISCLARDCATGRAGEHWWWRALLHGGSARDYVVSQCVRNPQFVPAAFERLRQGLDAVTFVREVVGDDAQELAIAVSRAFAVPLDALAPGDSRKVHRGAAPPGDTSRLRAALPECAQHGLTHSQVVLLAVALGLRRVPAEVRSPRFAAFVMETAAVVHRRARRTDEREDATARPAPDPVTAVPSAAPRMHTAGSRVAASAKNAPRHEDARRAPVLVQRVEHDGPDANRPRSPSTPAPGLAFATPAMPPTRSQPPVREITVEPPAPMLQPAPGSSVECASRFGGIFYGLNVALFLGLYGDFMQPRNPGIALSPWDLLSILGRRWFGRAFERDPVWRLLAQLGGRADDAALKEPRWMKRLAPRMEARIALALGERRIARALVRLACSDARVVDTGTRLDVHFDLARLPLAVRIAGLDRDPGWIPAAGRIVAFHFD